MIIISLFHMQAVNMFLRQAINRNTLPFDILPIKDQRKEKPTVLGGMKDKITMAEDFGTS